MNCNERKQKKNNNNNKEEKTHLTVGFRIWPNMFIREELDLASWSLYVVWQAHKKARWTF